MELEKPDSGEMTARNWKIVFAGLGIYLLGFAVLAMVAQHYHGLKGFLAPFLLIGGLLVTAIGLVVRGRH
jgi:hypothetical protein